MDVLYHHILHVAVVAVVVVVLVVNGRGSSNGGGCKEVHVEKPMVYVFSSHIQVGNLHHICSGP